MGARHEFKHALNHQDYLILRSRLRAVLEHDENTNENDEYLVRSLYFDTPSDKALREKIDGVNNREKFRIRYYNGNPSFIRLEKKSKRNGLCYKASTRVDADEARRIIEGDLDWMKGHGDPLLLELYAKMTGTLLRPRTIVDYIREPFIYRPGNVRITLDRQIRTGLSSTRFLDADVAMVSVGDTTALLEVKYDAFLPAFIQDLLQIGDRKAAAFSKYAACRIYG
ncbi:polyphosphate polymerase domain-containing protein [Eubacteriales bacterium OttesenSCG-928-A19]|nr:polyphosphate polymerase domain-containing protein [Eubacteriales bacterium OttesenSCG-928-A19]